MAGSLNDILPEPISAENERILLHLLKRKMKAAASMTVELLHAMEERFGPQARQVVRDMAEHRGVTPRADVGEPEDDLRAFCADLERGCVGSHRWERVIDQADRIGYRFTRCMWAEIYRELGEPELGAILCAGDEPAVEAHNPALGFKRTQVLMEDDNVCDHIFYVKRSEK